MSHKIDKEIVQTIDGSKYEDQFNKILDNRNKIGTLHRIDSVSFTELILIETYDEISDTIYVTEIFITDSKNKDTIVFSDGVLVEYYFPIAEIFEFPTFSDSLVFKKVEYEFLTKIETGGCVRFRKRTIKKSMKQILKNTFYIKSRITSGEVENIIITYPVKRPIFIIYRRVHYGGFY
jgi:hypothetical protein